MDVLENLQIKSLNPGACTGVDGWLTATNTAKLTAQNPATAQPIAEVQEASAENYEAIVTQSQKAFRTWQQVPAPKRGELIRLIAEELRAKKDWLGTLVSMEVGKIKQEGDGEVQEMIDIADYAVGLSRMLHGKTLPSERPQHRLYEQWQPLGPCGVISAFNFPVAVWAWNAFIAAVCGNTVIWKPSPKAALCAIAVQQICNQAMAKLGYKNIFSLFITREKSLAERLTEDRRVPLISFTGSISVGREVAQVVAQRLGRTILELSGNNAVIVDETADFHLAVPAIVFGAVGTTGQRCTTIRRVLVHESRYKDLVDALVKAYKKIKIGDPLKSDVLMGPLIDKAAVQQYRQALVELGELGSKTLYGGEVLEGPGYYVKPTIVTAENDWDLVQRETFVPILYIISYRDFSEAIALQNGVRQGLASALFTEKLTHAETFLSATGSDCGIANINISTSGAEIGGAFGGEKDTGGGREAGSDAWKAYMRRQTVTINWSKDLPLAQGVKFDI